MIIWGSTGREVPIGQGDFHCPQCDTQQHYYHNRIARYFTLYFIPLFQISSHGDYVQCGQCGGQFTPEVLHYTPPSSSERLALSLRADLDAGMPLHMAQQKLISGGMDKNNAQQFVQMAADTPILFCSKCS